MVENMILRSREERLFEVMGRNSGDRWKWGVVSSQDPENNWKRVK